MGPIRDFDFDAAILFSDLLFPLEMMGMGLKYVEGPELGWHLKLLKDVERLKTGKDLARGLEFQADALKLLKQELPASKGLLGFVGAPLTLFCYAVEGTHSGDLADSRKGLSDGRFQGFTEKLKELLIANMVLQARAGADAVAVFDTCGGEFDSEIYAKVAVPALAEVLFGFKKLYPDTPVVYYSRGTGPAHWRALIGLPIACLGIDWRQDLSEVLIQWGPHFSVQGNVDPEWLFLSPTELEKKLRETFLKVKALPLEARKGWICGLGHGVLPKTPENNVRLFIKIQKEIFGGGS